MAYVSPLTSPLHPSPDQSIIIEFLQFYADTPNEKNKFFSWKINSIMDLPSRLAYFSQRFYIRSAFYVCKENGKVINNDKIDLVTWTDYKECKFIRQ